MRVDFPPIPPGVIIPLVGAALVAILRQWWAPAIGAAVAAFLLIGGLVSGQAVKLLSDPGEIDRFAGMAVLILGVIVALVAGIVATVQGRRLRR